MALVCLGTGFHLSDGDDSMPDEGRQTSQDEYGWLVVAAMIGYLFAFGVGMSSVPWTINAEIYPTHARSLGTSASTTVNWLGNYVISATFLSLADKRALGRDGAFWLYATIGVAGWVWLYGCMPETKGLSLEEIELLFARPGDPLRPGEGSLSLSSSGHDIGGNGDADGGSRVGKHFTDTMNAGERRAGGFTLLDGRSLDGDDDAPGQLPMERDAASWTQSGNDGRKPTLI